MSWSMVWKGPTGQRRPELWAHPWTKASVSDSENTPRRFLLTVQLCRLTEKSFTKAICVTVRPYVNSNYMINRLGQETKPGNRPLILEVHLGRRGILDKRCNYMAF